MISRTSATSARRMRSRWVSINLIPSPLEGRGLAEGCAWSWLRQARRVKGGVPPFRGRGAYSTLATYTSADLDDRSIGARRSPAGGRGAPDRSRRGQRGRCRGADGPPPRTGDRYRLAVPALGTAAVGGVGPRFLGRRPALAEPAREHPAGDAEHDDALFHRRAGGHRHSGTAASCSAI